uniref:non-specific serine/threonine protein kinase n=1 Tax=Davidia involucrata TaxID=16924 RepID=A0A5B7BX59_DAVIN
MSSPPPGASPVPTSPPAPVATTTPPAPAATESPASLVTSPPPPVRNGSLPPILPPPRSPNNTTLIALGVGVGIGGTIVLIAVGIFVCWYKRRKRSLGLAGSYVIPPQGPKDEPFGQHWQQSAPPPTDNIVSMLPKPCPPPGIAANPQLSPVGASTHHPPPSMSSSLGSGIAFGSSKTTFKYEELARATDGFSNTNLLGQGGFGYVHKGVLPDGKEVAIKQLKLGSGQGEREFQAEIEIISRVHHKHLVSLVGYCVSGARRLLVYEFVPNNTLEFHLHEKGRPPLNWASRMKIALGSAKGLAYLHEDCQPKIIHRDIKAANILLDYNFETKVADFGLARLNSDTDTHISTRVMGTFGYLAPEYALTGKLTDKSDIFSFGVMLLELITGRRPIDKAQSFMDDNIVDWARPLLTEALEDGNFDNLADPRLEKDYDSTEMARMVACAAVCVRHLARLRPRMSQIVRALEGNMSLDDLNEGIRPGHSTVYSYPGSSDYDTAQYKEDLKKFRKMALESQEHNPSERSGPTTSEYGMHPSGSSSEGLQTTQEMGSSSEDQQTTQEMEMGK